ncbi:unnamed protein product [Brachionus calyciflorus]|uniref:Uncharacterized protein n=1 Tax=Brachionus calyciflorus TaxID=104777 RepID=A0A813ZQM1_9BILA|nr:unnamed protein product [Brachionus calyciflorus]
MKKESMKRTRSNLAFKKKELNYIREMRSKKEFREKKKVNDRIGKERTRLDERKRSQERIRDKISRRKEREDEDYRDEERQRDRVARREAREDVEYRDLERQRDRNARAIFRNNESSLIKYYEDGILYGPTYNCVCCGGLFFLRSVLIFERSKYCEQIIDKICFLRSPSINNNFYICLTCDKYAKNKRVANLTLSNGLDFLTVDIALIDLNDLEERLCSPRLPFIQIKGLCNWDRQQKCPRNFDESETIQLKLKRRLTDTNSYIFDTIRPAKIIRALRYLITKPLFTDNNIHIRSEWFENYGSSEVPRNFIVNEDDRLEMETLEINQNQTSRVINEIDSLQKIERRLYRW